MSKGINRIFVFNSKEEAERFIKLYIELEVESEVYNTDGNSWFENYLRSNFGEKICHKYCVLHRCYKEEVYNMMKYIGLKEKKFNGKKIYVYE